MPRPSAPSPNLAARGDGVPIGLVTEVSRAGAGSGRAPKSSDSFSSLDTRTFYPNLAGVPGFEPGLSVLETDVLTVDTIPLGIIADFRLPNLPGRFVGVLSRQLPNWQSTMRSLGFLMIYVLAAATTELFELETFGCSLLVLCSYVVPTLALDALQYNIVTRHKFKSPISNFES